MKDIIEEAAKRPEELYIYKDSRVEEWSEYCRVDYFKNHKCNG